MKANVFRARNELGIEEVERPRARAGEAMADRATAIARLLRTACARP